jgi:transposase InsO family protein
MKHGTQTSIKYLHPYYKTICIPHQLSLKAERRLKWMDYINKGNSVLKASRHFDIPEATVRYWYKRYHPFKPKTLEDTSKRPHRFQTSRVPLAHAQRVIELRLEFKGWDKVKIQQLLSAEGISIGQSRIQVIINQAGLKRILASKKKYYHRKNRRHMYAVPKEVLKKPGGLVYLDVKHLTLTPGLRVYQFTAIDHATRMLRIKMYGRITSRSGKDFLDYLEREYPFREVKYLGSDNGSEFMGELDQELERRGIVHVFSSPRSPKQNPYVERVIRSVIDEVYYYKGTEINLERQQQVLDDYVKVYNEVRPHYGINLRTPMEQYNYLTKHLNS